MGDPSLPPGITVNMIPGNRPGDIEWDDAFDQIESLLIDSGLDAEEIIEAVKIGIGQIRGGQDD